MLNSGTHICSKEKQMGGRIKTENEGFQKIEEEGIGNFT